MVASSVRGFAVSCHAGARHVPSKGDPLRSAEVVAFGGDGTAATLHAARLACHGKAAFLRHFGCAPRFRSSRAALLYGFVTSAGDFEAFARRHDPRKGGVPRTAQRGRKTGPMKQKKYEAELRKLQVQLCHLQAWAKETGARIVIVLEGRDGAGKGGTIKAITERVSPRAFRAVAQPAPADREKSQS